MRKQEVDEQHEVRQKEVKDERLWKRLWDGRGCKKSTWWKWCKESTTWNIGIGGDKDEGKEKRRRENEGEWEDCLLLQRFAVVRPPITCRNEEERWRNVDGRRKSDTHSWAEQEDNMTLKTVRCTLMTWLGWRWTIKSLSAFNELKAKVYLRFQCFCGQQNNTLDPAFQQHLEWLRFNWKTYFSSSSSSTWTESPTWWS